MAKRKAADAGNNNEEAYLIAFGSTMTILLALFITLSVLADTQEAGFKKGTGSFVRALDTFGLAALFDSSPDAVDFDASSPHYQVGEGEGEQGGAEAPQPSEGDVHDYEQERLTRMLHELRRQFDSTEPAEKTVGVAVVRLPPPTDADEPVAAEHRQRILELLPVLANDRGRVYVEVSTRTPEALQQAALIAERFREAIAELVKRPKESLRHIVPIARVRPEQPTEFAVRFLFIR